MFKYFKKLSVLFLLISTSLVSSNLSQSTIESAKQKENTATGFENQLLRAACIATGSAMVLASTQSAGLEQLALIASGVSIISATLYCTTADNAVDKIIGHDAKCTKGIKQLKEDLEVFQETGNLPKIEAREGILSLVFEYYKKVTA